MEIVEIPLLSRRISEGLIEQLSPDPQQHKDCVEQNYPNGVGTHAQKSPLLAFPASSAHHHGLHWMSTQGHSANSTRNHPPSLATNATTGAERVCRSWFEPPVQQRFQYRRLRSELPTDRASQLPSGLLHQLALHQLAVRYNIRSSKHSKSRLPNKLRARWIRTRVKLRLGSIHGQSFGISIERKSKYNFYDASDCSRGPF